MTASWPYHICRATENDAAGMLAFLEQLLEERNPFLPAIPGEMKYTLAQERELIAKFNASSNSIFFIARDARDVIGILNCNGGIRKANQHVGTIGISVAKSWRGRGVGTGLLKQLLQWARQIGVLKRLELFVYHDNAVAIRMYEKHGFVHEGVRRKAFQRDGEFVDDLIMALLL